MPAHAHVEGRSAWPLQDLPIRLASVIPTCRCSLLCDPGRFQNSRNLARSNRPGRPTSKYFYEFTGSSYFAGSAGSKNLENATVVFGPPFFPLDISLPLVDKAEIREVLGIVVVCRVLAQMVGRHRAIGERAFQLKCTARFECHGILRIAHLQAMAMRAPHSQFHSLVFAGATIGPYQTVDDGQYRSTI